MLLKPQEICPIPEVYSFYSLTESYRVFQPNFLILVVSLLHFLFWGLHDQMRPISFGA